MPEPVFVTLQLKNRDVQIKLFDDDPGRSLTDIAALPSNLDLRPGGTKFGDWDPNFTHLETRRWDGGRGNVDYFEDPDSYFDDLNLYPWIDSTLLPAPQWQLSEGIRDEDRNLPGDVAWKKMVGDQRFVELIFTAGQSYVADKAFVWIRRVGDPGTLTFELTLNSAGDPGTVLETVTKTREDIIDVISLFQVFDWAGTRALTSAVSYHVKIYGDTADSNASHWEIGVDNDGTAGQKSSNGSAWVTADFDPYFRVVDADNSQKWHVFYLDGGDQYAVSQPDSGSSVLKKWNETTDEWEDVSLSGDALSGVVTSVAVGNNIAHFARGSSDTIFTFKVVASTPTGQVDTTGGNTADILIQAYDQVAGPQIFRAQNSHTTDVVAVSRSDVKAFNTDLEFTDDVPIGDSTYSITAMVLHDRRIFIRKQDSLWSIANDTAVPLPVGLNAVFETGSTNAIASQNLSLFFSFAHSVERLTGQQLDDIGPWRRDGLPDDRRGVVSCILPVVAWNFWSIDAGSSGFSSVLNFNQRGVGELFRAPEVGQRIRFLAWQPVVDDRPRLWVSCGTDLYFLEFPQDTLVPTRDAGFKYQHEAVVTYATMDTGAAELFKYFSTLSVTAENLSLTTRVEVDYQTDKNIGTTNWRTVGKAITRSPSDKVEVGVGSKKKIRLRLRLITEDAETPVNMFASVLKLYNVIPSVRQLNIRAGADPNDKDIGPTEFLELLTNAADTAEPVRLISELMPPFWNNRRVIIDSGTIRPVRRNFDFKTAEFQGSIFFTVREADEEAGLIL